MLATTSRAFAKLGERRDALMDAVADALVAIVDTATNGKDVRLALKPQDVANLAWALAKPGARVEETRSTPLSAARAHLKTARAERGDAADDGAASLEACRYTTQQLTMLTWAHGMLAHEDEGLLRACVKEIRDRLGEFNTRDLTNTAWALDALGVRASDKPKLVERFGRAARRNLDAFNSQELLKFLGAFERLGGRMPTRRRRARAENAAKAAPGDERRRRALVQDTDELSRHGKIARGRQLRGSGRGNTGVTLWEGSFVLAEGCRGWEPVPRRTS